MASEVNIFENTLETVLLAIMEEGLPNIVHVVRGESDKVELLPLCSVTTTELEEEIYQSGIYRATVEFTLKDDLDKGSPTESAELFAEVLDLLQNPDLKAEMNDNPTIFIHGIVLGTQRASEIGDRMWIKSVSCEFFGYAVAS